MQGKAFDNLKIGSIWLV